MSITYPVVTLLAIAAHTFSGVAALAHFKSILPGMSRQACPSRG